MSVSKLHSFGVVQDDLWLRDATKSRLRILILEKRWDCKYLYFLLVSFANQVLYEIKRELTITRIQAAKSIVWTYRFIHGEFLSFKNFTNLFFYKFFLSLERICFNAIELSMTVAGFIILFFKRKETWTSNVRWKIPESTFFCGRFLYF